MSLFKREMDAHAKALIERTLLECQYNRTKAARVLGFDRKTLYNKIQELGLNGDAQTKSE